MMDWNRNYAYIMKYFHNLYVKNIPKVEIWKKNKNNQYKN